MARRISQTLFIFFFLLILLFDASVSGRAEIKDDPTESPNPAQLFSKMQTTRALVEYSLDYDYGGHNPKHEPRRGKPGTGSRNP
ncbi:hypothetical protein C4D60_Mb01t06590 [Musa balbisiana]|uniref:Transmembrane protein n=1 Tax=Musa balbisiana TaxID=52838 RepID=A0A4S8JKB9_MUSBA|nr:hypothetical protein C4D60_Mb01t06590 [Musa balbisiana]